MNKNFKRFNKILMMAVAILLCMVLASTSVVSGIFAKYAIQKSSETTLSLKAFGATLTVGKGADFPSSGVTIDPASPGASTLKVTISDLPLLPGQKYDELVKFTLGGTPNVSKLLLRVKVTVSGVDKFSVTSSNVSGVSTKNYIPFSFTARVGTTSTSIQTICSAWQTPADNAALAKTIASGLKSKFSGIFTAPSTVVDSVEGTAYESGAYKFTHLGFGFANWGEDSTRPSGVSDLTTTDLIQTYLSTKTSSSAAKLTITYTVTLEQDI